MQSSNIPTKIPLPFANSGTKRAIPTASQVGITPGAASLTDGFPPLTFTPLAAGGIPPAGADFNGILNTVTAIQQWQSAGGIFQYDSTFSTAIGGYPKGAVLLGTDFLTSFISTIENNTNDPNASTPVGWVAQSGGRLINVQTFGAGGTFAYTPTPGTKSVLVEVQGAGGAGGGAQATVSGQVSVGGGGGGGGYAKGRLTSGFTGSVVVGVGGAPVSGGAGGNGGPSSFAGISATGGVGAVAGAAVASPAAITISGIAAGGVGSGGNILNASGQGGQYSVAGQGGISGQGGSSVLGGGAANIAAPGGAGTTSLSRGGGGGGAANLNVAANAIGGAGGTGIVIIWEFS